MSRRSSTKGVVKKGTGKKSTLPESKECSSNTFIDHLHSKSVGNGSLSKKASEEMMVLSTPECIAETVTISCSPSFVSRSTDGLCFATPTLPQGASSLRKEQLSKTDQVKRKLDLECIPSSSGFKTPRAKRKRTSSISSCASYSPSPSNEKSRFDSSLGLLTKRFLDLLQSAENGILDLNQASVALAVQKRRIYDITNVLEGIGLLEKISKNNIQWRGDQCDGDVQQVQNNLTQELEDLEAKENQLDRLIEMSEKQLHLLNEDKQHAYVTYADLKNIGDFRNKTIMAIRAPPETKLEVPNPADSAESKYQIYIKSDSGEIDVFLCPEDDSSSSSSSPGSTIMSPIESRLNRLTKDKTSPSASAGQKTKAKNTNRQLLFEEEVLSSQLTTEDQNLVGKEETGIDISSMASLSENFLPLEPPLCETDYTFTMGESEGIADLFDFSL